MSTYKVESTLTETPAGQRATPALPPLVLYGWRGFILFAWVAIILINGFFGLTTMWGLGPVLDFALMAFLGFLFVALFDGIATLLWRLLNWVLPKIRLGGLNAYVQTLPGDLVGRTVGILLMVFGNIIWPESIFQYATLLLPGKIIVMVAGAIGAIIYVARLLRQPTSRFALYGMAAILAVATTIWLLNPGSDGYLAQAAPLDTAIAPLAITNPGLPGVYSVQTLSYGSGENKRRAEYGEEAALITPTVDGSPIFEGYSGLVATFYEWYNGFDFTHLPLNGLVWYPEGDGPFPLVLIVHGNHNMMEPSDPGYAYLGEHLASNGYIAVSVDENFLNGFNLTDPDMREMPLRAWVLLKHLELWREWNETPGNAFYGQIDLDRVGLIGHSRGGEAVAHASVLNTRLYDPVDNVSSADDFGFGIRGIVALAPSDNRYQPGGRPIHVNEADYLLLAGAHDQDMFYLDGLGQYTRATFDENSDGFKAIAYLYRANHGNFNQVWGDADQGKFESILLNRKPLLTSEEQQQAARVLITGFLEASLKDKDEYRAMFYRPAGARDWLPDDIVVTQYRDATFSEVAGNNQLDPAKIDIPGGRAEITGVANSQIIGYRLKNDETKVSNRGLLLEWPVDSEPAYTVRLPDERKRDLNLTLAQALTFNLVDMSENETPPTVWIELVTDDGATARLPLSHFGSLAPPLPARLTKAEWIATAKGYEIDTPSPYERLPQTFDLPLDEFAAVNPDFRPENLSEIRIRFDGRDAGKVMIDDMGFRNPL